MSLANQCHKLRKLRGSSLAAMGRVVGMAESNLSNVLTGKRDSRASTLEGIASALNAEWVLVPAEKLAEVKQVLGGKGAGPDRSARSATDIFLESDP
jgi:transcriptional regulator with XRE-family HTH domain